MVIAEQRPVRVFLRQSLDGLQASIGREVDGPRPVSLRLLARNDRPLSVELEVSGFELLGFLRSTARVEGDDQEITEWDVLNVLQNVVEFLHGDGARPAFGLRLLHAANGVPGQTPVSDGPIEPPLQGRNGIPLGGRVPTFVRRQPLGDVSGVQVFDAHPSALADEGLNEIPIAGIGFRCPVLLGPSQEVVEDCDDASPGYGLAFLLRLRHNLVVLAEGFRTIRAEVDALSVVVDAPGFAGFPVPGLCRTSHDVRFASEREFCIKTAIHCISCRRKFNQRM